MTELPGGSHLDPGQKLGSCDCFLTALIQAHKREGSPWLRQWYCVGKLTREIQGDVAQGSCFSQWLQEFMGCSVPI